MTFDDAVAALESAATVDPDFGGNDPAPEPSLFRPAEPVQQAPVPSAPQGENQPSGAAPTEVAPVVPEAPAAPVDTFDGGKFNPDTLPPELQPGWHQLQAAFTQKTQDVAEQRRQLEQLGDFNDVVQAAQLYQQLQDPRNWPRFQQEISQLMEQNGIAPPAPAAVAPVTPQTPALPAGLEGLADIPELAPIAQTLQDMQRELTSTRQMVEQRDTAIREEQRQLAVVGEFQRQEAVLRNLGLGDEDMGRVYELAHAHNGNLLKANETYQTMRNSVLSDYLAKKTEVQGTSVAPIHGAGGTSSAPPARPANLSDATDLAIETLKAAGMDTVDW